MTIYFPPSWDLLDCTNWLMFERLELWLRVEFVVIQGVVIYPGRL